MSQPTRNNKIREEQDRTSAIRVEKGYGIWYKRGKERKDQPVSLYSNTIKGLRVGLKHDAGSKHDAELKHDLPIFDMMMGRGGAKGIPPSLIKGWNLALQAQLLHYMKQDRKVRAQQQKLQQQRQQIWKTRIKQLKDGLKKKRLDKS